MTTEWKSLLDGGFPETVICFVFETPVSIQIRSWRPSLSRTKVRVESLGDLQPFFNEGTQEINPTYGFQYTSESPTTVSQRLTLSLRVSCLSKILFPLHSNPDPVLNPGRNK